MKLSRRQTIVGGSVVGALVLVVIVLWSSNRRAELARILGPTWTRVQQPPEYIGEPVSPMDAWAASRPGHMSAVSTGFGAGSRVLRTYPGSLMESPHSCVPSGFSVTLGGRATVGDGE